MSETMRGGESEADAVGDGDAVAEAEAVLETGSVLLSWSWSWGAFVLLVMLSTSPCAVASPSPVAAEGGAGTVSGGSSTPAVTIAWSSGLTADSPGWWCGNEDWIEAARCWQDGVCREPSPTFEKVSGLAEVGFRPQQKVQVVCPEWPTREPWFLPRLAKSAKG